MIQPVRQNPGTPPQGWLARLSSAISNVRAAVKPPSVQVSVSDGTPPDDPTYGPALADPARTYSDDALRALLERNADASGAAGRFAGLGKALLARLGADGADVSLGTTPASPIDGAAAASAGGGSDASLSVRTAGGHTVAITLHQGADGLFVDMTSGDGLTEDERRAVSNLAGAFQNALDGVDANPPRLALDGLMRNDPVLASVDFKARVDDGQGKPQTIALHADGSARRLDVDGPAGALTLGIDLTSPAVWGNQAQRQASIANVLAQMDDAAQRGHADASLIRTFKDAFSQLNSTYPPSPAMVPGGLYMNQGDHAALTGLADFSASLEQTVSAPNPLKSNELDTFTYDLSQQTRIGGPSDTSRTIEQHQSSHLKASYHQALWAGEALHLSEAPNSQNYLYRLIDDSARSDTRIAYYKGKLAEASVTRSANQSTRDMMYVLNRLVEDVTRPTHANRTDDLRALIAPRLLGDGRAGFSPESLSAAHAAIALVTEPYRLDRALADVAA